MTPEHWEQVAVLHRAALQCEESRRAVFLHDACAGDEDLRREVESLLAYEGKAETFMEIPALDVVVRQLAEKQALGMVQKSGTKLGPYEILAPLGAGGMGEVYRATDSKLNRDVALKILPALFTNDAERMGRFRREAQVLASLNHPNIGSIYGLEEWNNLRILVLELVEGPTLADRISRGAIPLEEALEIARQIAEAMAYAHEKGVTHRDLKPANIKITPEGNVKVLDFGLAKVLQGPKDLESDPSQSPTYGNPTTLEGMILGTAAYMSPEQAKGKTVDKRADIWAFGVVLYELLTGVHLFQRDTMSDTLAAVLKEEPDWNRIPVTVLPLLRHCLEKDPKRRLRDIGDMHLLLETASVHVETLPRRGYRFVAPVEGTQNTEVPGGSGVRQESRMPWVRRTSILFVVLMLLAAVGFFIYRHLQSPASPAQRTLTRLTLDDGLQIGATWSPDGRFIAYSSNRGGKFDIWVQQVSGGDPVQITKGPGHNWQPDWSPDGKFIAYRSENGGGGLFVVPALGGEGMERRIAPFGYYPRWSPDSSQILFQTTQLAAANRFYVANLSGSPPEEVLRGLFPDSVDSVSAAWHPDGKRITAWAWDTAAPAPIPTFWTARIVGGRAIRTEIPVELMRQVGEVGPRRGFVTTDFKFSWAPSGNAIYFERTSRAARNIWRMSVDPQTLRAGAIERLTTGPGLDTELSLSPDGKKLAFTGESRRIRAWLFPFDATRGWVSGLGHAVTSPGMDAWQPSLSRDGKRLAFSGDRGGNLELRETSLSDGREVPIMADDFYSRYFPQWSPDGAYLAYTREEPSGEGQLMMWSSQSRTEEPLTTSSRMHGNAYDWSGDGKWLLISRENSATGHAEVWLLPVASRPNAEAAARKVISSPAYALYQCHFSPDGRWIIFQAVRNQSSAQEIPLYVMAATGGPWIRITDGKHWDDKPRWSPDGKTIYFVSGRGGFFNVWGIRFDAVKGKPVGDPFQVTSFESPSLMIPTNIPPVELSVTQEKLVLTIAEVSGSIWVLDSVGP